MIKYISDWDKRKARHEAFWAGEVIDRPLVTILGPKKKTTNKRLIKTPPKEGADMMKFWTDGEEVLKRARAMWDNLTFVGDNFPLVWLDLGPSGHGAFYEGIEHGFTEETIWFHGKYQNPPVLKFDENSFWYKKTLELAKYLVDESKGEFFVSMPDTSGNADVLGYMQGIDRLMMDMYTKEEYIKPALREIQKGYERIANDVYDIVKDNNQGGSSIGWMSTWAPGKHAQMQCDMSVMISPEHYEEYIVEELNKQANFLDYSTYHFDGVEQIRHLDHILSIENLNAIQWTNVVGQPSAINYIDSLKKIQAAGKGLIVYLNSPKDAEIIMNELSSKGLHLRVFGVQDDDHAKDFLKTVEKLTHE